MDHSPHLKEYAENKVKKFEKFLHEPIETHVILQLEKNRAIAEITITAKNGHFNALEENSDIRAAIDLVVDKMESQLRKHKEKVKEH